MTTQNKSSSFGRRIRELRVSKGMILRKAAADLDIDQAVLSKLENGLLFPNNSLAEKIAAYYLVPGDDLKILLYSDKIMNDYGKYPYARAVIETVHERLTGYSEESEKNQADLTRPPDSER